MMVVDFARMIYVFFLRHCNQIQAKIDCREIQPRGEQRTNQSCVNYKKTAGSNQVKWRGTERC